MNGQDIKKTYKMLQMKFEEELYREIGDLIEEVRICLLYTIFVSRRLVLTL